MPKFFKNSPNKNQSQQKLALEYLENRLLLNGTPYQAADEDINEETPDPLGPMELSNIALDDQGLAYFIAYDSLYHQNPAGATDPAVKIADLTEIVEAAELSITSPTVNQLNCNAQGQILITFDGTCDIIALEADATASVIITQAQIQNWTGQTSPVIVSLDTDSNSAIYITEQTTQTVIKMTPTLGGDSYVLSTYADQDDFETVIKSELANSIVAGDAALPINTISSTTGTFVANSLVKGSGDYGNYYYVTQLSSGSGGDGSITRIAADPDDPESAVYTQFFTPSGSQTTLNPAAIAIDTSTAGTFDNLMFLGTFGASMGDDLDGQLYTVAADGTITEFVTSYIEYNQNGEAVAAEKDGLTLTGFFDVIDLAFSPGGDFGDYIYLLSENIAGNYSSDLWRISPDGTAELWIENIADGVVSLDFSSGDDYGDSLYVGTWQAATVLRIDSLGNVADFYDFTDDVASAYMGDLIFTAEDSVMGGRMAVTIKNDTVYELYMLNSDGTAELWTDALQSAAGYVADGDLILENNGDLTVLLSDEAGLATIAQSELTEYTLGQLNIREATYIRPYVAIDFADEARIMNLGQAATADLATEVAAGTFSPDDTAANILFDFDADGDIYLYSTNVTAIGTATRVDPGVFEDISTVIAPEDIDQASFLTNATLSHLEVYGDGKIMAIAQDPDNNTTEDDALLTFTETATDTWQSQWSLTASTIADETAPIQEFEFNGETLQLRTEGSTQAALSYLSNLDGDIKDLTSLIILQSNSRSEVVLANIDDIGDLTLDEIVINDSLGRLIFGGDVETITAPDDAEGKVSRVSIGSVQDVLTPGLEYTSFQADSLGDADTTGHRFLATGLKNLQVLGDVANIQILPRRSTNSLGDIVIDGVITDSEFNSRSLSSLTVNNLDNADVAVSSSTFYLLGRKAKIGSVTIEQGDIDSTLLYSEGNIKQVTIEDGNLTNSAITAPIEDGKIGKVIVRDQDGPGNTNGNIDNVEISADKSILTIHADGDVSSTVEMTADGSRRSRINRVSSGGDFAGSIQSTRLGDVLIGYDLNKDQLDEDDTYTGSDFTGTAQSTFDLKSVKVTGSVTDATLVSLVRSINHISAEDGFTDTIVSATKNIKRIMVGYEEGRRSSIVNSKADVSGTIYADKLGRVYFTGDEALDLSNVSKIGPVHDDVIN